MGLEALPALPPYQMLEVYPNDKGLRKDSPFAGGFTYLVIFAADCKKGYK